MLIRQADIVAERADIRELWHDYLDWMVAEIDRHYGIVAALVEQTGTLEQFLDHSLNELQVCVPPAGRLLLAVDSGSAVGCGTLLPLDERAAVIQRMYVRPAQRGRGIGRQLLEGLLQGAREAGYQRVLLESARFMHGAHALYRSASFTETEPYPQSQVPRDFWPYWIFMERVLD